MDRDTRSHLSKKARVIMGTPDVTTVVAVLFIQGQLSRTSRLAQAASGP